jgi:hypothetical protein
MLVGQSACAVQGHSRFQRRLGLGHGSKAVRSFPRQGRHRSLSRWSTLLGCFVNSVSSHRKWFGLLQQRRGSDSRL